MPTQTLFLTSSIKNTLADIVKLIPNFHKGMSFAFISTASELEEGIKAWVQDDLDFFNSFGFDTTQYSISNKTHDQVLSDLDNFDVMFVAGGNAFYLLDMVHKCNFVDAVRHHTGKGKVYIGESSGSLICGPTLKYAYREEAAHQVPNLKDFSGMGIIDFMVYPHWGNENDKEFYLEHRIPLSYNTESKIILLTNRQFVFVQDAWYRIVEAHPDFDK